MASPWVTPWPIARPNPQRAANGKKQGQTPSGRAVLGLRLERAIGQNRQHRRHLTDGLLPCLALRAGRFLGRGDQLLQPRERGIGLGRGADTLEARFGPEHERRSQIGAVEGRALVARRLGKVALVRRLVVKRARRQNLTLADWGLAEIDGRIVRRAPLVDVIAAVTYLVDLKILILCLFFFLFFIPARTAIAIGGTAAAIFRPSRFLDMHEPEMDRTPSLRRRRDEHLRKRRVGSFQGGKSERRLGVMMIEQMNTSSSGSNPSP